MAGAYLFRFASDIEIMGFYFVYVIVVLSALYGAHKYGWKMHKIDTEMPRRDRRNVLLRKAGWVYHWSDSIITIALIVFFLAIPVVLFGIDGQFAFTALSLASLMALLHFMPRQNILAARITTYCVSIFSVYLLTVNINDTVAMAYIDGFLIALTIFLMVAIRMSRREQFRLDTQDLLMLLIVIIVPQLPLESLKSLSIGSIALRAAVLMYACEFLIAHGNSTRLRYLTLGATVSLAAVGITHI
jgi:UDP-GlcNAc:undecaprenyl-phosphate GlcNAc-1-phosphate transferase